MANEWESAPTARTLPEFNMVQDCSPRDWSTNAGDVPQAGSESRKRGVRGRRRRRRRGAILALFVVLCVVLLGLLALTVDVGLIQTSRREAQVAADSAALAAAAYVPSSTTDATAAAVEYAGYNKIADTPIAAASVDVEFGTWAPSQGVFTPALSPGNAVKVTVRRDATHAGPVPLYFGRIFNHAGFNVSKSAIAMTTPRDIIFVVDTSGSLNDEVEPAWATTLINSQYSGVGTTLMQQIYTDMGFGTFPGNQAFLGSAFFATNHAFNYADMTRNGGNLSATSIPATYRIVTTDSEATRKDKAYRWIIDNQLKTLMPNAKPAPDSTNATSRAYWSLYLDYVLTKTVVTSTSTRGRPRPALPVTLPPSTMIPAINSSQLSNPSFLRTTTASTDEVAGYRNILGYRTYVQLLCDFGRMPAIGTYLQLSTSSPNCVYHNETIDGVSYSFPPSEQPMHAIRRALISTINLVNTRNQSVGDSNQRDRIGLLTIDSTMKTALDVSLTANYSAMRDAIRTIQATSDEYGSTALDANVQFAGQQLLPTAQGRAYSRKIIIIISDSIVTKTMFTNAAIDAFQLQYPPPQYFWFNATNDGNQRYESNSSLRYARNGALMAALQRYQTGVEIYAVKVGFTSDQAMVNALADFGGTANTAKEAPTVTNNPSLYESRIKAVLADIIDNPRGRLVQ
jgi:hypothetical protein